ncbi:MAG: hypothetical protein ACNI3A_12130 [Desulfovibrio sp.]|uniref:hypothetical protein n=1 Tax=Desulfovibrio sp. 7SRBS1 TaxID=3378064 RepID=UPI003B3D9650
MSKNSRVKVRFHAQEGGAGNDDIFVSVNGRAYLIQRERDVMLPREVLEVVENAEQTIFEPSGGGVRARHVKRFAYTVLEAA